MHRPLKLDFSKPILPPNRCWLLGADFWRWSSVVVGGGGARAIGRTCGGVGGGVVDGGGVAPVSLADAVGTIFVFQPRE